MKWDLSEQYLPWRYFISKCINNGELPFWNPFQLGGYPAFADPQSGVWYLPTWIISYFFGYSMKIIELEILCSVTLGSIGFYTLCRKIGNNNFSSLAVTLCYACSGFMIGNAQHITWIMAAVWIPWLFYHYLFIREKKQIFHVLLFALCLNLFITSSYPAFAIVVAYLIFGDQLILFIRSKEKGKFILNSLLWISISVASLSAYIYSIISSVSYFSRGAGITLEKALQHSFTYESLISLLLPFSSFKNPELFKTDISMSNAYFGLIPLLFILIWFTGKKSKAEWCLFGTAVFFLLMSFGSSFPLREFFYHYIPGFDLFRFPSLFRFFFILFSLLLSASVISRFLTDDYLNRIKRYALLFITLVIGVLFFIYKKDLAPLNPFNVESLSKFIEGSTFANHISYQLLIQLVVLIFLCIILFSGINKKWILLLVCADMFISTQLNFPATIIHPVKTKDVDALIANAPEKFDVPSMEKLITQIDQKYEYRWPLNWNMNCYFGQIAIDGYNPFVLNTFNALSDHPVKDSVWQNPWYYFPSKIIESPKIESLNSSSAYINSSYETSYSYNQEISSEVLKFGPDEMVFKVTSDEVRMMVLAQNPYPDWKCIIDGVPQQISTVNLSHQGVYIPKGESIIEWKFIPKILYIVAFFNFLVLLITSFLVLIKLLNIRILLK